ncbi:hypothetical protein [Antarctobacter sp.]|uniref:hypothetical protein n=1 Tax=Antarctobacter sp. TaxID=1872577 RepID=UPI002B269B5A|nr:hypothetical protein [Antarctobacter sp.]
MTRRCLTLLLCLPVPLMAQQNLSETGETALPCPGPARAIALAPAGSLDLDGATSHLTFGPDLRVCFTQTDVTVIDGPTATFACTAIRDSDDEGLGYYFTAEGIPHHLWFHIDATETAPSLQIGLYREEAELVWIDTAYPICGG